MEPLIISPKPFQPTFLIYVQRSSCRAIKHHRKIPRLMKPKQILKRNSINLKHLKKFDRNLKDSLDALIIGNIGIFFLSPCVDYWKYWNILFVPFLSPKQAWWGHWGVLGGILSVHFNFQSLFLIIE